jgi:hypothetical protein
LSHSESDGATGAKVVKRTEIAFHPFPECESVPYKTYERQEASRDQAVLKPEPSKQSLKRTLLAVKSFRVAEYLGKKSRDYNLRAEQNENHSKEHGVDIESDPAYFLGGA